MVGKVDHFLTAVVIFIDAGSVNIKIPCHQVGTVNEIDAVAEIFRCIICLRKEKAQRGHGKI